MGFRSPGVRERGSTQAHTSSSTSKTRGASRSGLVPLGWNPPQQAARACSSYGLAKASIPQGQRGLASLRLGFAAASGGRRRGLAR